MKRRFIVEVVEEKKTALFVFIHENKLTRAIRTVLQNEHIIYEHSGGPDNTTEPHKEYDVGIFVGYFPEEKLLFQCKIPIVIIINNELLFLQKKKWCEKKLTQYKIINLGKTDRTIQDLVHFILFKTPIPYAFSFSKQIRPHPYSSPFVLTPKQALKWVSLYFLSCIIALNIIFFIFFIIEGFFFSQLSKINRSSVPIIKAKLLELSIIDRATSLFVVVPKNTLFWVPGIDYVLQLQIAFQKTTGLGIKGSDLFEEYQALSHLFLRPQKTKNESDEIVLRLSKIKKTLGDFGDLYYDAVGQWKKTNIKKAVDILEPLSDYISLVRQITTELPDLLGGKGTRRYLFLFMNNMELRPGGGFIGSLGVMEFSHFSLTSLRIYDVYSLDGQLKLHYDPPAAIRTYLDQPHLFVRDAAFSPDFGASVVEIERLIQAEVGWDRFDGVIGVTLSAVQKLIGVFPDFYVSSYDEWLTPDNFFIKAQEYAETGFFPGSHGKRNFLESVVRTAQTKLEEGDYNFISLVMTIGTVFDEKLAAVRFSKESVQSSFDELFWTGRVIKPGCNTGTSCFFDYVQVVDANLGVNKANFFVQRSVRLATSIDRDRHVSNSLTILYQNNSIERVFPGGRYKNYLQVYLPQETLIRKVAIDGEPVLDYVEDTDLGFKRIGFLAEVPIGSSRSVTIQYDFTNTLGKEKEYQLIVQKQIGLLNNDFIYQMHVAPPLGVLTTNFTPVVRKTDFVYNTFLEKDRLLLIKFK